MSIVVVDTVWAAEQLDGVFQCDTDEEASRF